MGVSAGDAATTVDLAIIGGGFSGLGMAIRLRQRGIDDPKLEGSVWSSGCASWYIDATGRNATLWPDWTWRFRRRTSRFDAAEYSLRASPAERDAVRA